MRNLLDLIFANLIPIIIVVSVVIRIFVGIKNSARGQSATLVPKTSADDDGDVWSRLKPDDDDDERGKPEPYRLPVGNSQPLLTPVPPPEKPVFSAATVLAQPLESAAERPGIERLGMERPGIPGPGPLDRLDKLSPLRRAVVLAEILGPPKGLD
jgi:hypothetical protein